ncbi:hypothetical protein LINPERPRIM_LOCUS20798 [Linum perenne]
MIVIIFPILNEVATNSLIWMEDNNCCATSHFFSP